ncbi:hypothetical protein AB0G73_16240 [Streptomyces sp. NPDC020719]|uniref:hypothetical protein n=1 Tax=Streptomyces sp. NPDC020719 TaxID=3154896 RepID=UPI0033F858F0
MSAGAYGDEKAAGKRSAAGDAARGFWPYEPELTPDDEEALGEFGGTFRPTSRHVWMMAVLTVLGSAFAALILVAMRLSSRDGDSPPAADYVFLAVFALVGLGSPFGVRAAVRDRRERVHLFDDGLVDVDRNGEVVVFLWRDVARVVRSGVGDQPTRGEICRSYSLVLKSGPSLMVGQNYGNCDPLLRAVETAITDGRLPRPRR